MKEARTDVNALKDSKETQHNNASISMNAFATRVVKMPNAQIQKEVISVHVVLA